MAKSLSKTDSLRDLQQFFSREQLQVNKLLSQKSDDHMSFRSEQVHATH